MYLKVLSDDFLLYPSVPDQEMCTLDNGVIGGDVFEGPPSSIHAPAPPSCCCCCCNTALLVNAALLPLSFQFNHHKNRQHHHPNQQNHHHRHSHDHHQLHCSHHNHASLLSIIIREFCCAAVVALLRPI